MTEKDPLDEIILTKKETKWYNKGKAQGKLEMKIKMEKEGKKTPKLTLDQNRLLHKLEEHDKRIKNLEKMLDHFKYKYLAADKRIANIMGIEELEKYPKLKKKIFKEAGRVIEKEDVSNLLNKIDSNRRQK